MGCILGKKNKSIHLLDPFTSIPIKGTKIIKLKLSKKNKLKSYIKFFFYK